MGQRAASTNERLMHTRTGVQHAAKTRGRHTSNCETRWGALAQGSQASPPMRHVRGDVRRSRRRQWRSGGGPGEGCLADTGRCHGRWVYRTLQRLEDLRMTSPCVMAAIIRRAPLTPGAARHSERKHALEQSRPGPRGAPVSVASSSMPCCRGVGMIAPRRWLWDARQPL